MKIYTEVNYIWKDDKLIQTDSKSYDYEGEVAQCWVGTAIAATTAFLSMYAAWRGAEAAKKSGILQGGEYRRLALSTLLTAKFNIGKAQARVFQVDKNIKELGMDKASFIRRDGLFREGKITATIGSSGVRIGSGTSNQQIIKSRLDAASRLMQNQEEIMTASMDLRDKAESAMESEWMSAVQKSDKLKRMANMAESGANTAYFAAMMGGFTSSVSTFDKMGGFKNAGDWFSSSEQETDTAIT